jgi:hypothetical protein
MQYVGRKDVEKLANDPISFAILMNHYQLEHVIVTFVCELNKRKPERGG